MIPFFNRPPYSLYPVRRHHVALIAASLLAFAAGCYFLGGLVTVRLLCVAMMLCAGWVGALFGYRFVQALRHKSLLTIYGPVAPADRPTLFVVGCVLLIVVPLMVFGLVIYIAQSPNVRLFRWLWP
jgi:hypothetical protein